MTLQDKMYSAMTRLSDEMVMVEVTLSLDTLIYASGDVLADTQEVANTVRAEGGYGKIIAAAILDKDDQAQGLDLIFMRTNVSLGTENVAPSMSDADAEEILSQIEFVAGDYVDLTNNQVALQSTLEVPVKAASGSTSIFMGAISRGTGTYTAAGIVVKLFIEQY